jgi:uncharacterized protein (TIGR04255 family)
VEVRLPRRYENPPANEAICELRLAKDSAWDLTIPGRVFEKVQSRFPIRKQQQVQTVEIRPDFQPSEPQVDVSDQLWLLSEDEKSFVRLGPRSVSVHRLAPYPGWEKYFPDIELTEAALVDILGILDLERIGLRYVNRISIPAPTVDLEKYFQFRLELGESLPQETNALIVGAVCGFDGDVCRVQLADTPADGEDMTAFILDLDYWRIAPPVEIEVLAWVGTAHTRVEELFEGSISDPLRELFGVVSDGS